nr:reverse transcriptase domain-containing protein [Tanacetum cinerariifolium]
MQTRSSLRLTRDQTSFQQKVENSNLEEHLPHVVTMADNRTMAELLRAPTEGASRRWLQKEPPCSITTWEDLLLKFINEFFPPSRTTSLRNEISNFKQKFDESFHEAWDRYKDLLRACPHHSFTELHQLDTFYNALNPADQDSLNAAAGGNLLERSTQDVLTIIENKSKIAKLTHAVNQQTSAVTTAMTAMLKQFQATPPPAQVKAVEEICVTCIGAHPYYQCLTVGGNTFPEFRDNIQGYISAAVVNYNQGSGSLPSNTVANPKGELKAITTHSGLVTDGPTVLTSPKSITSEVDERVEETYTDPDLAEYTIKVPPPPVQKYKPPSQREFVVHKRDPLHPNIPYPSRMLKQKQQKKDEVQIQKFWQMFKQLHINITLADALVLMLKYQKMLKALIELNCKALADLGASINLMPLSVWKKLGLPELIPTRITLELANRAICTPAGIARDVFIPVGKFTFPADFVIVDYESDPRVPFILGRPFLRTARALIDVHGEEMILRDGDERLTLNMKHDTSSYSNQPQRESVNLINIFNVSSEDFLEVLFSNQPSGNLTFLPHKELTSPEVTNDIFDSEGCNVLFEKLPDLNYTKDLHPPLDDNLLSGSTTYSSNSFLEEFTDELDLITYPLEYDDNLQFDIDTTYSANSLLEEFADKLALITYPLDYDDNHSIDQSDLTNLVDLFVDPTPEMFTDEQLLDYSFPPRFDVYPDDFFEIESDADTFDELFDSKGEKINEAELLIDQLDLPCDILFEYDSFNSQDFSRDDDLPSPDNEDKVFNSRILSHEKSVTIITHVAQEKKLAVSYASLLFKDFDPPFYDLLVFKEVPNSMRLLPFYPENEEKVFKPGIYTSEKVKEYKEKDKIESKPDKNGKRREAGKSQKQLQSVDQEKLKKIQKEVKVIREKSKELGLLMIKDDLFTYDTPLGAIFYEFNRLSKMDDDLFTYEVKIHGISFIPYGKQQVDDSDDGDLDEQRMCQNENESLYAEAVIFVKEKLVRLIDISEDEVLLGDEELLDLEDENLID